MNRLIVLLASFLVLTLGSGIGTATEIFIQPGTSIQTAVDNATIGDIIVLKPGTYSDNLKINTNSIEIRSESGNPDDTIIKAENANDNVLSLQADNLKISGLELTGANGNAGIYLSGSNNCTIQNNRVLSNGYGIYLLNSKENILSNNKVTKNKEYGILFSTANQNTLSGNTVSDNNGRGIHIGTSDGNTLSGNTISSNVIYGLFVCPRSDDNHIFNNYFNNNVNAEIKNGTGNAYYIEKTEGKNIAGGSSLAGNFWAKPDGAGFSETAVDTDGDGISDSEYKFENSIYADRLPLVSPSNPKQPSLPTANFNMNTTNGSAPLSVQFIDASQNSTSLSWDFESDGKVDSTNKNPVHVYTEPGEYTINLTVANEGGKSSKTAVVTVAQAAENNTNKNVERSNAIEGSGEEKEDTADENNINNNNPENNIAENSGNQGNEATGGSGATEPENSGTDDKGGSSGSSSGSSHSSGGIGGSPEPQENVEAKEISQTYVTKGETINFTFPKNSTCVVHASFDAEKTAGKTTAIAELLKESSSLVPELPSGEIYKFFNLWIGNSGFATPENIESPILCFKVEKAWIQDKKIDPSSIILNRYRNESWEQLPANVSAEDDKYFYFTAKTDSFSFFAISGNIKNRETTINDSQFNPQTETVTGNISKESSDSTLGAEIVHALGNRTSERSPGFGTIYCVISLIALFLYKKKSRN